jgi:ferredoxin
MPRQAPRICQSQMSVTGTGAAECPPRASTPSGGATPDAHATPVPKDHADRAFDAATCIGCGACAAACPNASATLFLAAKITHLGQLPQGHSERDLRVVTMLAQHDAKGFGACTNIGECAAACPKQIPSTSSPSSTGTCTPPCATATDAMSNLPSPGAFRGRLRLVVIANREGPGTYLS